MDANQLLALLGRRADDAAVEEVFVALRTRRRPELDPEDRDSIDDWVLVRKKGVELGFTDEAYFHVGEKWQRRRQGTGLLLHQVYFYNKHDDIADFAGSLPFGLTWSDTRKDVRRKLGKYNSTRRSYRTDTWELPEFRMIVSYKEEAPAIDSILCLIDAKPWPEEGRVQPALGVNDWMSLFGLAAKSSVLRKRLQPLKLAQRITEDEDEYEVDFTFECGLELYFTESKHLKGVKKIAGTGRTDLVLGAVQLVRSRELDGRQWNGELPFRLSFDDSQETMFNKIGRSPDEQEDDRFSGIARWHFPDFSLEVMYNNVENYLLRVMLMAPGYWQES